MNYNRKFEQNSLLSLEKSRMPLYYENSRWRNISALIWNGFLLLAVIVLLAVGIIGNPHITSLAGMKNLFPSFLTTALLAVVMAMIFCNGGIDLSIGSTASLTAILVVMNYNEGMDLNTAVISALAIALLCGLINGLLVGFTRLPGFLITLASMFLLKYISLTIVDKPVVFNQDMGSVNTVGWLLLAAVTAAAILWVQFPGFTTRVQKSRLCGAKLWMLHTVELTVPYIISGIVAGFTGLISLARIRAAYPYGSEIHMDVIFAVILGGTYIGGKYGNIIGAVLGAFFLSLLRYIQVLNNVNAYNSNVTIGIILAAALLLNYGYNRIAEMLYRRKIIYSTNASGNAQKMQ